MATGNSPPGADRTGIDFQVRVHIPWNAPEAYVMLDSRGLFMLDTADIPDILGLQTWYPEAAPVKIMKGRAPESVCVLIPDDKEPDRGFYYMMLVDMLDEDASVLPVPDLNILRRQWPLSVVSGMSRKQTDYESLRH